VVVVGAEHDARDGLGNPVVHRRRIAFVDDRWWVVVDDLEGLGEHEVDVRFQLAPLPVRLEPGPWARITGRESRGLLLRAFSSVEPTVELHEGETQPIRGWVSSDYGQRQPAPQVVFSVRERFPLRILTLLLPVPDAARPAPSVSVLCGDDGEPAGLVFDEGGDGIEIEDDASIVRLRGPRRGRRGAGLNEKGQTATCAASSAS
jgi:hypothetical protein